MKKLNQNGAAALPAIPHDMPRLELEKPGADRIALPPTLIDLLTQRKADAEAKARAAMDEFNRAAELLLIGFLNGCPDADPGGAYDPSPDFKFLKKR